MRINIPIKAFSVNGYYTVYRGMKNISKKGREWREKVLNHISENYPDIKLTDKPLKVIYDFGFRIYDPDYDNYIKAIQDTLEGVIWENDKQIQTATINKYTKQEADYITIEWEEI